MDFRSFSHCLTLIGLGLLVFLDIVNSYAAADEMVGLSLFDGSNDCYFHTGEVYTWGQDEGDGRLGLGGGGGPDESGALGTPSKVTTLPVPVVAVTCGGFFTISLTSEGQLWSWGDIEPWTIEQHVGEAVFIPAGCPFQVRNLQSSVQLGVDFLSPESLGESIRLAQEICSLSNNHEAKL